MISTVTLLYIPGIFAEEAEKSYSNDDKVSTGLPPKEYVAAEPVTAVPVTAVPSRPMTDHTDSSGKVMAIRPDAWVLRAEQWELARDGKSIVSLPVINTVVNLWLADTDKTIEILYPGGEEGEFWIQELSDWLVSLGIPSRHLRADVGSGVEDEIRFDLVR